MHLQREQLFYRGCIWASLYLWTQSFLVCFNAILSLKKDSKVISVCNLSASVSWINPTHLIICCSLFGLFLLSLLIIHISLCFSKPFPTPKLDPKYTFLPTHHVNSLNHILLLILSFPSISLTLLPFFSLLLLQTLLSLISLLCLLFWTIYTFVCFFCCWWYLLILICYRFFPKFSYLAVTILCFRIT